MKLKDNLSVKVIVNMEDGLKLNDLKKKLKSYTHISNIVNDLSNKGILDLVTNPQDKRTKVIFITEKGLLLKFHITQTIILLNGGLV